MGNERVLEDDRELELEDLDEESEQETDSPESAENGVPDTEMDRGTGGENGVPDTENGEPVAKTSGGAGGENGVPDTENGEPVAKTSGGAGGENGVPDTENGEPVVETSGGAGGENGVPDTENGEPVVGTSRGTGGENGVPDTENGEPEAGGETSLYERGLKRGSEFAENMKGKADTALGKLLPKATALVNKHKAKFFQAYDSVMDLKDEMHYASKDSGGGLKGFKSAAGVLGRHIKESDSYKKFMNSKAGRGIQAVKRGADWTKEKMKSGVSWVGNKIKSGASRAADKFNGTKLGRWIQEKRANKSDEPGFFGKAWNKVKSGASRVGDKIKSGAAWAADKFNGTKLGKWIQEKRANKSDEPGFFSKAWDKVKTGAGALAGKAKEGLSWAGDKIKSGASWAGDKIKSGASWAADKIKSGASWAADKFSGTRLGQWIQEKRANKSDEPGFFGKAWDKVKTGASALAGKVKEGAAWVGEQKDRASKWLGEQKKWAGEKIDTLKDWKHRHIDEALDNHEHERRIRFMERQGDSGYGQRYQKLVNEMGALPGIERLKGIITGGDIEEVLLDLDNGKGAVSEKVESAMGTGAKVAGGANSLLKNKFIANRAKGRFGAKAVSDVGNALALGQGTLKIGKDAVGIVRAKKLSMDLSKMENNTSDQTLKKGMRFAKRKADRDVVTNSFDAVKTGVTTAGKIFGQKAAAKVVNTVAGLAESSVTSSMDKETRKDSLKGLLGGVEGYRQLKERYKLRAPEMRRAIRQAIGVSSEDDVVNMDRLSTSQDIMKSAQGGDQDSRSFAQRMKAGSSSALYKAMGGGDQIFRTQNYSAQEA